MPLNLIVDRVIGGKIYPSLARHQAEPYTQSWREFGQHWPNTIPLRLQEYFEGHGIAINIFGWSDQWPTHIYYPIALGWFDFDTDYFGLLSQPVLSALSKRQLKILFYYHEGDNPERIKHRLDQCVASRNLPDHCYIFVSSNSAADQLAQFVSFQDSELWYWHRNRLVPAVPIDDHPRSRQFTVLNRLHKWWRAAVMADLQQNSILQSSYWSYCEGETDHDLISDCPIELDAIPDLRSNTVNFVRGAPYFADNLTQQQRNDHHLLVEHFYSDAYCNIVLETMFDWDQSGGTLLSEKTFKPIKHGQLFFVAGGAGSLAVLRSMGYHTFDHVLDNSYDNEADHTRRWIRLRDSIIQAQSQGIDKLYLKARSDIEHNQKLFLSSKRDRLSMLLEKIYDKSS